MPWTALSKGPGAPSRKQHNQWKRGEIPEDAFRGVAKMLRMQTCVTVKRAKEKERQIMKSVRRDGQGEVREQPRTFFGAFSQVRACEKCHGAGEIPKKACPVCRGVGRVISTRDIRIEILPGIEDGQLIKVKGMGEAGERGAAAGDLYVRMRVARHPVFARQGNDLIVRYELNILDLLAGRRIELPTIEGKKNLQQRSRPDSSVRIIAHFAGRHAAFRRRTIHVRREPRRPAR